MKRTALSILIVICILSFGFWTGRSSAAFLKSDSQMLDEMNQVIAQAAQTQEVNFLKEMIRREMQLRITADPMHRYGGQPCRTAD